MLALCHTSYSLQAGVQSPKAWIKAAVDRGYDALAVIDVNGLHGAVDFYRAALEAGIRPLVGATVTTGPRESFAVLSRSAEGYRQLCRLLSCRCLKRRFSIVDVLPETGSNELLFLSRYPTVLQQLVRLTSRDNVYLLPTSAVANSALWDTATIPLDVPMAPIPDAWFLQQRDREPFVWLQRLRMLSGGEPGDDAFHPGALLVPATDWQRRYPAAARVSRDICDRCDFRFDFNHTLFPRLCLPSGESSASYLRQLCRHALPWKYDLRLRETARRRTDKELDVICDNGFADYFLYVHEIIRFAQEKNIPVGVRGSAASSLVSYLLGFTHSCPIEHDLYFERFMNPGRKDCPDIDIDIADNRRDEVIAFCYRHWGADHVAMIATVSKYRPRSAVRDVARLLELPVNAVARFLDAGDPIDRQVELVEMASCLTGLPRHLGIHCGGLVITPGPLTDATPLTRTTKGVVISHYEKDQAEAIGLIKMDLLGNSALSVIDEACRLLDKRGVELREQGPRYDYKVNRLFAGGDTLGVYQCESPGMRQLCRALAPATPKEVSMALSLIRPGPAAAGMKDVFIRRRRGIEPVSYLHPRMEDFLGATYGVMLYQEDVMKVAVQLGGYTLADADSLRRAVSKDRESAIFAKEQHRFVFQQAAPTGVSPDIATKIWTQVSQFASYSYCKAHATVYGRLAWLMARLKAHYPREFYTAILNCHKSMYPLRVFVWDALRHGVPILPVDICHSEMTWTPTSRGIRAGLELVRGLRQSIARRIVSEHRRSPFMALCDFRNRIPFQAGELERLILIGACRAWGSRETLFAELMATGDNTRQLSLFVPERPALPPLLDCELAFTGVPFSIHPVEPRTPDTCMAMNMSRFIGQEVEMTGILDTYKHVRASQKGGHDGRQMSFVTLEDATGLFEVVLFPDIHERYGHRFSCLGPHTVTGRISEKWGSHTLELQQLKSA